MRSVNLSLISAGVLLVSLAPAQSRSDKAKLVLQRALEKGQTVTFTAVQTYQKLVGDVASIQLKIQQRKDGLQRRQVLQPLTLQGILSVDDGKTWTQLYPDDKTIFIQESPRVNMMSPSKRLNQASENYEFSLGKSLEIAGRPSVTIVAKSKSKYVPTRRFFVDAESSVMLRLEQVLPNGEAFRMVDTMSISFPEDIKSSLFEIKPASGVRVENRSAPVIMPDVTKAAKAVGFNPIYRANLAFGFTVSSIEVIQDREKLVVFRVSDGIASCTIYARKTLGIRPDETRFPIKVVDSIAYSIMGDLPEDLMRKLLDSFVGEGGES